MQLVERTRIVDDSAYVGTTGRRLSSDRLTFQPDWTASFSSDYRIETGADSRLTIRPDAPPGGDFASLNGWDAEYETYEDFDLPTYVGLPSFMKLRIAVGAV